MITRAISFCEPESIDPSNSMIQAENVDPELSGVHSIQDELHHLHAEH